MRLQHRRHGSMLGEGADSRIVRVRKISNSKRAGVLSLGWISTTRQTSLPSGLRRRMIREHELLRQPSPETRLPQNPRGRTIGRVVHDPGPFPHHDRPRNRDSERRTPPVSSSRGFMVVSGDGVEEGRVPLDDIACAALQRSRSHLLQRPDDRACEARSRRRAVRSQLPARRLVVAAGRPPRPGAAYALPARCVQAAPQAAVAVHREGQDSPAGQHARSSGDTRQRPETAGAPCEVRRPG